MTRAFRIIAVAIALAGLVDPPASIDRKHPVTVDLRAAASPADPDGSKADRIKRELTARLDGAVTLSSEKPAAVVLIGGASAEIPDGVPVSTIASLPRGRNVSIIDARVRSAVVPGQRAIIDVQLAGADVNGQTSLVTLEHDGLEVARATHNWQPGRALVRLTYAPPGVGPVSLRVRAVPLSGEVTGFDNVADVSVTVVSRPLRVLTWEARPSWAAAFVRRALEADPLFESSSVVRSSRGLDTKSGTPPDRLDAAALARFDVIAIGAPEELRTEEVAALDRFAHERGGVLLLLPDRAPEGPYRALLPSSRFDEVLLQRPASLTVDGGATLTASELALPRDATGQAIATLDPQGARPAIVSWPRGAGLVVFSGALDAWRYRDGAEDRYAKFWTALAASLAVQASPSLALDVEPSAAAPGDPVRIRARYRDRSPAHAISASLVAADGRTVQARLWPSAVAGEFEGTIDAPGAGRYDVRLTGDGGLAADGVLSVEPGVRTTRLESPARWIAAATGGVAADASDLSAVETFIRALPQPVEQTRVFPMRSPWWIAPFALALCAEWALRRRKGLR